MNEFIFIVGGLNKDICKYHVIQFVKYCMNANQKHCFALLENVKARNIVTFLSCLFLIKCTLIGTVN